ncbi:MAG: sulfatase family protein [Saccharofermentanales bacterium]
MKKTNILLITSDQQHFNTIGAFNPEIKTPNLDRLVREGTYFERAYCPNPTCTPTRASIITGKYPSQHGAWTLGTKLPETEHTVGTDFQKAGYATSLIGKAHFQPLKGNDEFPSLEAYPVLQDLDFWKSFDSGFYGFEHVELARNHTTEAHVGQHYALWLEQNGCENWRDYFEKPTGNLDNTKKHIWEIPEEFHYDNWIAQRTNAMLDEYKAKDRNFFMWASFFDPHPAYFVPHPWEVMYDPDKLTLPVIKEGEHDLNPPHFRLTQEENPDFGPYSESGYYMHGMHSHINYARDNDIRKDMAIYYSMVSLMDKYVGRILDKLDELGMTDNTLVIFTTDHGHFFGHHGLYAKGPFMYEDLIKIPFIARLPGKIPSGAKSGSLQSLVDLAPSFLDICGIDIPAGMTGISQKEVWFGKEKTKRDFILCEHHHEPTTIHLKTFVNERYKITVYFNHEYGELFDLESDPSETFNLWDNPEYKDLKAELLLKFIWAELAIEPVLMPRLCGA